MMAARGAMLLVVAWLILAALGATGPDVQPSALRLAVTAVVGLLAPLFWPGVASTPLRTALRVGAWSGAAAGLAAFALWVLGDPPQPLPRILGACGMLMLILLLTHALAAALEARWRALAVDAENAREMAGRTVAVGLALVGALPLWLGPVGELLSARHEGAIDAVVGASPLTHLALASGNDLLRNQWFYQQSNLAALQVSYPGLANIALSYAAAGVLLGLGLRVLRRAQTPPRPMADEAAHPCNEEKLR